MRQHPAPHDEKPGGGHDDPDDHKDDFVEPIEGEPMREDPDGPVRSPRPAARLKASEKINPAKSPRLVEWLPTA